MIGCIRSFRSVSILLIAGLVLLGRRAAAAEPTSQITPEGIAVRCEGGWIEAATDAHGVLRLSVVRNLIKAARPSVFLAPVSSADQPVPHLVRRMGWVGVATAAGTLWLEPGSGNWRLEGSAGEVLIPGSTVRFERQGSTTVTRVAVRWPKDAPFFVYGSGNGGAALRQLKGDSGVDNGIAKIPYYWSKTGYAALAVTADDAQPASWAWAAAERELCWSFPGDGAQLYLMPSKDLRQAATALGALSGRAPVPPRWTFGYLQSRWGWRDRADIEATLREFRTRRIPVDAFIFDFEWYTPRPDYNVPPKGLPRFPDFSWNPGLFPEPAEQLAAYRTGGVRFVGIRKPRLGDDQRLKLMHDRGWALHPEAKAAETFHARDMDFRNPDFSRWYADQLKPMARMGIDGWWNDEGEGTFLTYYYWNEAERAAVQTEQPGRRFWSLNRAFSPGLQRLGAAAWTGDLHSTWDALRETPTSLLNWSLAGMTYTACDIGGFREATTPELLARWMEAGVFFPLMRAHASREWTPHLPWRFGPAAEAAMRAALELRYRLVPYYYSLAHEAARTGVPLMRPLAMEFPQDDRVENLSDQWLMGPSLMAAPVLQPTNERSVYLPGGRWYRFETGQALAGAATLKVAAGLAEIPVYVRAGSILPLASGLQSTQDLPGGPLEVQVYTGQDATFTLTEDDGETDSYQRGQVREIRLQWNERRQELSWKVTGPYVGSHLFHDLRAERFGSGGVQRKTANLGSGGSLRFVP